MRRRNGGVDLIDHDRYVRHLLYVAGQAGLAAVLALLVGVLPSRGATAALGDAAKIDAALGSLAPQQILEDLNASVRYLESRPVVAKTRIGAIGFGVGGSVLWLVLTSNPDVKTAVAISGVVPSPRVVS